MSRSPFPYPTSQSAVTAATRFQSKSEPESKSQSETQSGSQTPEFTTDRSKGHQHFAAQLNLMDLESRGESGDSQAAFAVGEAYYWGMNGASKNNTKKAFQYYKLAADGKPPHIEACNRVAWIYHLQNKVLNATLSFRYYKMAANAGDDEAQNQLGLNYHVGLGVDRDDALAVEHWRESANRNNADAQYHLGEAFENGWGVEKAVEKAFQFYNLSASQGDRRAIAKLKEELFADKVNTINSVTHFVHSPSLSRDDASKADVILLLVREVKWFQTCSSLFLERCKELSPPLAQRLGGLDISAKMGVDPALRLDPSKIICKRQSDSNSGDDGDQVRVTLFDCIAHCLHEMNVNGVEPLPSAHFSVRVIHEALKWKQDAELSARWCSIVNKRERQSSPSILSLLKTIYTKPVLSREQGMKLAAEAVISLQQSGKLNWYQSHIKRIRQFPLPQVLDGNPPQAIHFAVDSDLCKVFTSQHGVMLDGDGGVSLIRGATPQGQLVIRSTTAFRAVETQLQNNDNKHITISGPDCVQLLVCLYENLNLSLSSNYVTITEFKRHFIALDTFFQYFSRYQKSEVYTQVYFLVQFHVQKKFQQVADMLFGAILNSNMLFGEIPPQLPRSQTTGRDVVTVSDSHPGRTLKSTARTRSELLPRTTANVRLKSGGSAAAAIDIGELALACISQDEGQDSESELMRNEIIIH